MINLGVKFEILSGVLGVLGVLLLGCGASPFSDWRRGDLVRDGEWSWEGGHDTGGDATTGVPTTEVVLGVIGADHISLASAIFTDQAT